MLTDVRVLDSATQLDRAEGVVVAASHGGVYAAYLAAAAGARAVVLNDAGVGKDEAGVSGLPYLDDVGVPAATVAHDSARIADGLDTLGGTVSRVNDAAANLGCRSGQPVLACLESLRNADPGPFELAEYGLARFELDRGDPPVWGTDSLSVIGPEDRGRIAITGSHGARLAGEEATYIPTDVAGAVFNDAGIGKDRAGVSRMPALADRGIPAATVAHDSARIGDARSTWESGVLSVVNEVAAESGVKVGDDCPAFAAAVRET
jgi:hypothetical protein